jgi:hypothetical protein
LAPSGHRFADEFFSSAIAIKLGRVDQRHSEVEAEAEGCDFLFSWAKPLREVPRTLPERGDRIAGG